MAKQRLARQDRARAIVQAAMGLFARRGFSGVKTRQIARAAGVSEALLFKCFPHKHSLYRAILTEKIREAEHFDLQEEVLEKLDDESFFAAIAEKVLRRIDADDTFFRLLIHSALEGHALAEEFHRQRIDRRREQIERRIRRLFARRRWRAPVDPAHAARLFIGLLLGSAMQRCVFRESVVSKSSPERWARTMARVFLGGLEARGEEE